MRVFRAVQAHGSDEWVIEVLDDNGQVAQRLGGFRTRLDAEQEADRLTRVEMPPPA